MIVGDLARTATAPSSFCLIEHVHGALTGVPVDAIEARARLLAERLHDLE